MSPQTDISCPNCGCAATYFWQTWNNFRVARFYQCRALPLGCGPFAIRYAPRELVMRRPDYFDLKKVPIRQFPLSSESAVDCPACGERLRADSPPASEEPPENGIRVECCNKLCQCCDWYEPPEPEIGEAYQENVFEGVQFTVTLVQRDVRFVLFGLYDAKVLRYRRGEPSYEAWLEGYGPSLAEVEEQVSSEPFSETAILFKRIQDATESLRESVTIIGIADLLDGCPSGYSHRWVDNATK